MGATQSDNNCYWDRYPDVATSSSYGRHHQQGAYSHYQTWGQKEGRLWGCKALIIPPPLPAPVQPWTETGGNWIQGCKPRHAVGGAEPPVFFFNYQGCRGAQMQLSPGNYSDLNSPNKGIARNDIDSIVIPGNMLVQGFSYPNFQQATATWGPGIHGDLNNPNKGIGINDIDSLKIIRQQSWSQYLEGCCLGANDAKGCLAYAGPAAVNCRDIMKNYCSQFGTFKTPQCQKWCSANKASCDPIATKLCTGNSDPFCGCFNSSSNLKPPSCFDPKCTTASAFKTTTHTNQTNACNNTCSQYFNDKSARAGLLQNAIFMKTCGTQVQNILNTEAETERKRLAEIERQRLAAEAERQRLAAEAEIERQRLAAEAERKRLAAEAEIERQRLAAEAERKRLAEIERKRLAEIERKRLAEIERKRLAEIERQQLATKVSETEASKLYDRQRLATETEASKLAENDNTKSDTIPIDNKSSDNQPPATKPTMKDDLNVLKSYKWQSFNKFNNTSMKLIGLSSVSSCCLIIIMIIIFFLMK